MAISVGRVQAVNSNNTFHIELELPLDKGKNG